MEHKYTIKESNYANGGFKVKCDGETFAQLSTLKSAIEFCQKTLQDLDTIEFINAKGEKKEIVLFED